MSDPHEKNEDRRPEIARDDEDGKPREGVKEKWHNAEDTMGEGPAGDPSAEKRSRTSG